MRRIASPISGAMERVRMLGQLRTSSPWAMELVTTSDLSLEFLIDCPID